MGHGSRETVPNWATQIARHSEGTAMSFVSEGQSRWKITTICLFRSEKEQAIAAHCRRVCFQRWIRLPAARPRCEHCHRLFFNSCRRVGPVPHARCWHLDAVDHLESEAAGGREVPVGDLLYLAIADVIRRVEDEHPPASSKRGRVRALHSTVLLQDLGTFWT